MTTIDSNDVNQVRSADGTAIAFESVGSGPAVIIVEAAPTDTAKPAAGEELTAQLATTFTVYTYRRRGPGSSEVDGDADREVEDVAALIAEAGGSANLFGAWSGAPLAIRAAAAGLHVDRLAVFDPPTDGDGSGQHLQAATTSSLTVPTLVIDSDAGAIASALLEFFGS